jgi:hypothetical protein
MAHVWRKGSAAMKPSALQAPIRDASLRLRSCLGLPMHLRALPLLLCAIVASLPLSIGCAPSVAAAAKAATQGATDQTLQSLEDARVRQQILGIVRSPEMQATIQALASGVTKGVMGTVASDDAAKRTEQLASAITETVTRTAIDSVLSETTTRANEQRLQEVATLTANTAVRAAMSTMASELRQDVGPALGTMMREDIAPSLRGLMGDPEIRGQLGTAAFEMARQAVLGSNEGMAELEAKKPKKGFLAHMSGVFAEGGIVLTVLLVILLGTIGVLAFGLLHMRAAARRDKIEHDVKEDVKEDVRRERRGPSTPVRHGSAKEGLLPG